MRFELMHRFRNDGLANRSFNHSGNYPHIVGGSGEIRTHGAFADSSVFKTDGLNHSPTLPKIGWSTRIRTGNSQIKSLIL